MQFLYLLEDLRNPVFDFIFSIITLLGEETLFMAIGLVIFWCIDKFEGYYLLCAGFFGTLINQTLKIICRVPRPWVKDPNFTVVESAVKEAKGYSFPSGHTQCSVGLFGGIARWNKSTVLRIVMISLCVLVPFSRMYLGVHTPLDVVVSIGIALLLIFVGHPLFKKASRSPKVMYSILISLAVINLAYLLFVSLYHFPAEVYAEANIHNLKSAQENSYTLFGCAIGLIVIYTADLKLIKFDTKAVWWAQVLKVVIGIILVLATKELLKLPLDFIFGGHLVARSVRYFCIVLVGGALYPLTFRWFAKLGKKK